MSLIHSPVEAARTPDLLVQPSDGISLGRLLLVFDLAALTVAGLVVLGLEALTPARVIDVGGPLFMLAVLVGGPIVIGSVGLHQRRRCAITSVEISRIGRASLLGGVIALVLLQAANSSAPYVTAAAVAAASFTTLVLARGGFRTWLKGQRQAGEHVTPVVVVGARDSVVAFAAQMRTHPDSGYRPVAHVDVDDQPFEDLTEGPGVLPCVGHVGDDLSRLRAEGVDSAVLLADGMTSDVLSEAVRSAEQYFAHVQVVTNLTGVSHARLVPTPLVGEMTFYLEPLASPWQRVAKRAMDVVVSALLLVLAAPVIVVTVLAIKLHDGGPVLYSQERIGKGGHRIRVWKFRSMVVDADRMLEQLAQENQRQGPLFKAQRDPRITPVGRFLRASSIDELPQLWSILVGDMSLVGPRPALPSEVEDFDNLHRRRHEVRPGLTGLWQIEDRDHPDFERYRRHDVFYVENWSLSLDVAILLQTAVVVVMRAVRAVTRGTDSGGME